MSCKDTKKIATRKKKKRGASSVPRFGFVTGMIYQLSLAVMTFIWTFLPFFSVPSTVTVTGVPSLLP